VSDKSEPKMPLSYFIGWIIAIATVAATLWGSAAKPTYATTDRVDGIETRVEKNERLYEKLDSKLDRLPARIANELDRRLK
jgi:hypothetical protein